MTTTKEGSYLIFWLKSFKNSCTPFQKETFGFSQSCLSNFIFLKLQTHLEGTHQAAGKEKLWQWLGQQLQEWCSFPDFPWKVMVWLLQQKKGHSNGSKQNRAQLNYSPQVLLRGSIKKAVKHHPSCNLLLLRDTSIKHAECTSKWSLDEKWPHFGASFSYYNYKFHNLSFTSQNKNSLSRFLHNYLHLQNSRSFILLCILTDNTQIIKTMFSCEP